jgi:hypothetical protein
VNQRIGPDRHARRCPHEASVGPVLERMPDLGMFVSAELAAEVQAA